MLKEGPLKSLRGRNCHSGSFIRPEDQRGQMFIPEGLLRKGNNNKVQWGLTAMRRKAYLSLPLWSSSCWSESPWRPRRRRCRRLPVWVQSACRWWCLPLQRSPGWSHQQRCSSACSHRSPPALFPMSQLLCSLSPLWSPGWTGSLCLSWKSHSDYRHLGL